MVDLKEHYTLMESAVRLDLSIDNSKTDLCRVFLVGKFSREWQPFIFRFTYFNARDIYFFSSPIIRTSVSNVTSNFSLITC